MNVNRLRNKLQNQKALQKQARGQKRNGAIRYEITKSEKSAKERK